MEGFDKIGLDNYLTNEYYDDGFNYWCELVIDSFSDEFFNNNEEWIMDSNLCETWLSKLFHKSPEEAS
ncbi:MAG: hypothetical protein ACOCP8_05585, partial [archaeon]